MSLETTFQPRASIVIPVYNGANYLGEAIDCALAQTYPDVEVIVVNDGSCDDGATEAVALSYGNRIRYFSKENGGVSSALNLGIRNMTGDYFSWLSHDDKYEPGKVEHSIRYLSAFENREKLIALCGGYYIDLHSEKLWDMEFDFQKGQVYDSDQVLHYILRNGAMDACCMLIPKRAFEECGYFNEDLRYNQDALMWYQIFCRGYGLVVDPQQRDVMYRLHANQTSKTRRDLLIRDSLALAKIIAPSFAERSGGEHNLLRLLARRNARQFCVAAAEECIRVGKLTGVFGMGDVCYVKLWLVLGYLRNFLKRIYHRLFFIKRG